MRLRNFKQALPLTSCLGPSSISAQRSISPSPHSLTFTSHRIASHRIASHRIAGGRTGYIKWQDTSTGKLVAEFPSKLGPCRALRQNPHNAVTCMGHGNGTVTMWSPNISTPLVKMLCHRGPVNSLAVDTGGRYMVTSGMDKQLKVWDVRTFRPVQEYFTDRPAASVDISQRGLIAAGFGPHVQIWKDAMRGPGAEVKAKAPYMRHLLPSAAIESVRFRPYDDVLGIGHSLGVSSMVVPGAGEPNFDSFVANPYRSQRQRREATVQSLLDKLDASMITLNPSQVREPFLDRPWWKEDYLVAVLPTQSLMPVYSKNTTQIGNLDRAPREVLEAERKRALEANAAGKPLRKEKKKMRGKSRPSKRQKKRRDNIIEKEKELKRGTDAEREKEEARLRKQRQETRNKQSGALGWFGKSGKKR